MDHTVRPDQQMFGLLTAKSHITEHIPGGGVIFSFMAPFPFSYPSRRSALRHESLVTLLAEDWKWS